MVGSNADYYEQHKPLLRMTISGSLFRGAPGGGVEDLRRAQVGAAFAVAAHYTRSVGRALVCMPTGSGKSAVMTLLPFLLGSARVLVVTPSKLLREQLAAEFISLGVLRRRGVTPVEMVGPRVEVVRSRVDERGWSALREFDVVVGTVNVLSPGYADVAPPPSGLFDLVLVDEAHHSAASTYQELLTAFEDVPTVLFTATPFRRDRHHLPAEEVYTYGLGQALDDGVLAPIDFIPVEVPDGSSEQQWDVTLATAALEIAAQPEHRYAGTRIIARTRSVKHARELVEVYREAGGDMGLITASTSSTAGWMILSRLRDGHLAGLVSVGVLGEGFDFPTLKIGVYHRRHASLPATLQFLGRLTRLVPDGPRACLLALREEVNDETRDLYAADVAWAELVPALADAAVESEARRRLYLRNFDPEPTRPLSLSALRPRKDVMVFTIAPGTPVDMRVPIHYLGGGEVIYQGTDEHDRVTVIVTEHLDRPEWMAADTLDRFRYELHVVVRDRGGEYLFVHGTRDSTILALVKLLGVAQPRLVDPQWMDRLMAGMPLVSYHSVGMRSTRTGGGRLAAYRMMAGTNVGTAVLPSETRSYGTGHAIAQVHDPMKAAEGEAMTLVPVTSLGVSFGRSKVFSPDHAQLLDFRIWCDRLAELVAAQGDAMPTGLPNLALRSPRSITRFPEHPYLVILEHSLFAEGLVIHDLPHKRTATLEQIELTATGDGPDKLGLTAWLDGEVVWRGVADTFGAVSSADPHIVVEAPARREKMPLAELLENVPPTVFFADGSSVVGNVLHCGRDDYPDLSPSVLTGLPFTSVDIRAEAKKPRGGMTTIKNHMIDQYSEEPEVEFIVDDDRAQEVADLVVFGRSSATGVRQVTLVHCKYSSENKPGARVKDLYEVLGQAGRSVVWLRPEVLAKQLARRLRDGSRVAYGDSTALHDLFAGWQAAPSAVEWSVVVVQPGLRASLVNKRHNVKVMLSDVHDWVAQHGAEFQVIGHS